MTTLTPTLTPGYAMLEGVNGVVLPADVAIQVFALLCQGEPVEYDWSSKSHKRRKDSTVTLRMFSVAEYATLALNDEVKE